MELQSLFVAESCALAMGLQPGIHPQASAAFVALDRSIVLSLSWPLVRSHLSACETADVQQQMIRDRCLCFPKLCLKDEART